MKTAQSMRNNQGRRAAPPELVTTLRGVWQDNPTQPSAPSASPQPAPREKETRTALKKANTKSTQPKNMALGKDIQLNLWVRPVVKAELERVAKREGLSVSAAGEAFLEKALHQDIYTQHGALLETILDKAVGRHMRIYSDRNASLQARNLQKTELLFHLIANMLGRMPGMNEETMSTILNEAQELANTSIARVTPQQKKIVEAEKEQFTKEGKN